MNSAVFRYFAWLVGLLWLAGPAAAQAPADEPNDWHTVWLDSAASVRLPYASAQPGPEPGSPLVSYHTGAAGNQFYALGVALEPEELPGPNQSSSAAIDQLLLDLMRRRMEFFAKPKFQVARPVLLPASPDHPAMHRLYQGVDEFHQAPALLELLWLLRDHHLYVLYCTYSLPQEVPALADVHRFLGSLAFATGAP